MPRKPTNPIPVKAVGRKPVEAHPEINTPITDRVGSYFEPKIIEDDDMVSVVPESVPGYDATRDLFKVKKDSQIGMSPEEVVRLASTAATFGQQPRISALTESVISDKPYDQALTENQAMLEYIRKKNPVGSMAVELPVSLAATAPIQSGKILGRLGYGALLGAGYGSEQQDLGTSEGIVNTGVSAGMGAGLGLVPNLIKGGSDFVKKAVNEASEGGTTVKNLIRDYIVKKNNPEILETLVNKPNTISDLANVGSEKVKEKMIQDIAPFRDAALKDATSTIALAADDVNALKQGRELFGAGKDNVLTGQQNHALIDLQRRLETDSATPQKLLNTVDLMDSIIDYENADKATNIDRRISNMLKPIRDSLKEKLRSPMSEWGAADKAYSTFNQDLPAVKALEQAKFDYAKKSAQADFPKLGSEKNINVYPTKTGALAKIIDFITPGGGLKYTDQISEDIATKLVDPDYLMQAIQAGDREIVPGVKPTGLLKAMSYLGYLDQPIAGVSPYNALSNEIASQTPKLLNEE